MSDDIRALTARVADELHAVEEALRLARPLPYGKRGAKMVQSPGPPDTTGVTPMRIRSRLPGSSANRERYLVPL